MESKSALFFFSQFVNGLRNKNAKVRYEGTTYSAEKRKNTIRRLVQVICDFDSEDKINTVSREHSLTDEHSKGGSVEESHKDVVNQLIFYFDEGPKKTSPWNRTDLYIEGGGTIGSLYKNLPLEVNENLVENFKYPDIDSLFKHISWNPDSYALSKLRDENFLQNKSLKKEVQDSYSKITARYCQALAERNRPNSELFESIIPEYKLGYVTAFGDRKHEITMRDEDLYNGKNKFDRLRYKRIRIVEEEFSQDNILKWPPLFIAHLLLMKYEERCIVNSLIGIVFAELKYHLKFSLYTSSKDSSIRLQKDIDDLESVAQILSNYLFPGDFDSHISIERDTILQGNFSKHPDELVIRNPNSVVDLQTSLTQALAKHFFTILCEEIGLDYSNNERCRKYIDRLSYFGAVNLD